MANPFARSFLTPLLTLLAALLLGSVADRGGRARRRETGSAAASPSRPRRPRQAGRTKRSSPEDPLNQTRAKRGFQASSPRGARSRPTCSRANERSAEVEFQSIEGVRLRYPGDNRVIIPVAEFSGQALEGLNDSHRIDIRFGLDYGDQTEFTTSMRETTERGVEARWRDSRWADALLSISAEFFEAGASSLD